MEDDQTHAAHAAALDYGEQSSKLATQYLKTLRAARTLEDVREHHKLLAIRSGTEAEKVFNEPRFFYTTLREIYPEALAFTSYKMWRVQLRHVDYLRNSS